MRYFEICSPAIREGVDQEIDTAERAHKAYSALANYLSRLDDFNFPVIDAWGQEWFGVSGTLAGVASIVGLPNLLIMFGKSGPYLTNMTGRFVVLNNPLDIHGTKYEYLLALRSLKEFKEEEVKKSTESTNFLHAFEHEITHAIDYARTNGSMFQTTPYDVRNNRDAYANDNPEVNAIYHAIAGDLTTAYRELKGLEKPEWAGDILDFLGVTGNFQTDLKRMLGKLDRFDREMFSRFSEANKRSVLKRIYRLHQAVIAKRDEILQRAKIAA